MSDYRRVYVEIIKQTEAAIFVYQHGQGLYASTKGKATPTARAIGTALHIYPQMWVLTVYSQSGGA